MRTRAAPGMVLCVVGLLTGCQPREAIVPPTFLPPQVESDAPLPSYGELAARYNARAERLQRLWASTDVQLRWRDEDGDARLEEGDGNVLFVRPDRLALTVEKFGKYYLWTGSDEQRFWLFDMQEDAAYVGNHRNVGKPCMQPLPLPIHPSTVPYLLGLMPLPTFPAGMEPPVERLRGYYLVEPPGLRLRLLIDPQAMAPVRVDLTDETGHSAVIAQLSEYAPVELSDQPPESWPRVASRADLFVVGEEARMTLQLSRLSDGEGKIRDRAFDFEALVKAHRPKTIVVLDRDCD